jgi:hypothetical protein
VSVGLSDRELATVLAALRYWQHDLGANEDEPPISEHFADGAVPLSVTEIDDLCERLNVGTAIE